MAASMGSYINLMHGINQLEHSPDKATCKKEVIDLSKEMISAADQTIAETIMLMIAESARDKNPIFCVPKNFDLNADSVEHFIIRGYETSGLPLEKKQAMPAATFAILELHKKYPCPKKGKVHTFKNE